ncbi:MAG: hypothetical protein QXL94_05085, partial [Candidatus Parvarchaeum sp.]
CGLADLISLLNMPYESEDSRKLMMDIVAMINYTSKLESVRLAKERGPFGAFLVSRYANKKGYIESRYSDVVTNTVTQGMWKSLSEQARIYGIRNITTVALPPTGRSALTIDASAGIAPFFSLVEENGEINANLEKRLRDLGMLSESLVSEIKNSGKIPETAEVPEALRNSFKTALDIDPYASLKMQAALQRVVDDAISNTINLKEEVTVKEVELIFMEAYREGLKGITIYRQNSRIRDPKRLARNEKNNI